jgi:hypothetical protein
MASFFYSSPNDVYSCLLEGARLGIRRLRCSYKDFLWQLKGILGGTFVAHTGLSNCFTFGSPLFTWCPSFRGPIPFFSLGALSFLSESSPRVNKGVCSCYESPHPPGPNFNLFKDHHFFASFSSFIFILAMFKLFDGIITISRFGFFFRHV